STMFGFVIRAKSESAVRMLAAEHVGDEGSEAWLSPKSATCTELKADGQLTQRSIPSDRDRLTRSLAVDTRERRSTWLWRTFHAKCRFQERPKQLSGPGVIALEGALHNVSIAEGVNHEVYLPGLRGREAVGCNVRERARSHNRGVFCLRRHPAHRRLLD